MCVLCGSVGGEGMKLGAMEEKFAARYREDEADRQDCFNMQLRRLNSAEVYKKPLEDELSTLRIKEIKLICQLSSWKEK